MKVFCDDELYLTADEIEYEIAQLSEMLNHNNFTDIDEKKGRLDMLIIALQNL